MKSQAFKLLLATWFGCMTSIAVALPDDVSAELSRTLSYDCLKVR